MKAFKKRHRESSEEVKEIKEDNKKNEMPNFLLKLYQILETNEYSNIIEWGENGRYFVVKNLNDFTDKVCPKFFKHNNFSSFVRQRNSTNENIFQHKNFIRSQKNLIKTIKRKNNHKESMINNTSNEPEEELGLVEYCTKELSSKKMSKCGLEKILTYLIKTLNETNEKQKVLEYKVEDLGKQNEEFIIQNQQMIQEIISKNDYTKKLETLLFFIIEILLPKQSFKNSDSSNNKNLLAQTVSSNGVILPNSQSEFKAKALNDVVLGGIGRSPLTKSYDGINDALIKSFFDKFFEHTHPHTLSQINQTGQIGQMTGLSGLNQMTNTSQMSQMQMNQNINQHNSSNINKIREKLEFLPMLTSSKNEDMMTSLGNATFTHAPMPPHIDNTHTNSPFHFNNNNNNNNNINNIKTFNIKNSPMKSYEIPKMEFEDQNSVLFRNPSPNPFLDDLNFSQSNLFSSPRHEDNFPFFSRNNSTENIQKNQLTENNILCMNNFTGNQLDISRNNSMDLNEMFKNGNEDDYTKKLTVRNNDGGNNYVFDDSYFSVSSDQQNRSEAKSEFKLEEP